MKNVKKTEAPKFRSINHVIEYVLEDGLRLKSIPEFNDNAKVVLAAVTENYLAFEFASNRLKDNDKMVFKCCDINIYCFEHASERLKNDEDFVLSILESGLVHDRDHRQKTFFRDSLTDLFDNSSFVLRAVKFDASFYYDASYEIRTDIEFAKKAIRVNYYIYYYDMLSDEFKANEEIVRCAIEVNGINIITTPKKYKKNIDYVMLAVKHGYPEAITELPKKYLNNKEFILEMVKANVDAYDQLACLCPENRLVYDKDIFLEAIKKNGAMLVYGRYKFGMDRSIAKLAVKSNGAALKYLDFFWSDREIVLDAVKSNGYYFKYASDYLKNDKLFVKEVLLYGGADAFDFISDTLKADDEIIDLCKGLF